jgi:hypothetical protein
MVHAQDRERIGRVVVVDRSDEVGFSDGIG